MLSEETRAWVQGQLVIARRLVAEGKPKEADGLAELVVTGLLRAGHRQDAAQVGIAHYEEDLRGLLQWMLKDDVLAEQAFTIACRSMEKGISGFRADSPFRVWAYTISRRAALAVQTESRRRPHGPADGASEIAAPDPREDTRTYQMTEVKQELARIEGELPPDAQRLLRIIQAKRFGHQSDASWIDVAVELGEVPRDAPAAELSAADARVRRRAARLIETLRKTSADRLRRAGHVAKLRRIVDALPEEDRLLLTLHVDKELSWTDVARVLGHVDEDTPPEALASAAQDVQRRHGDLRRWIDQAARERELFPGGVLEEALDTYLDQLAAALHGQPTSGDRSPQPASGDRSPASGDRSPPSA